MLLCIFRTFPSTTDTETPKQPRLDVLGNGDKFRMLNFGSQVIFRDEGLQSDAGAPSYLIWGRKGMDEKEKNLSAIPSLPLLPQEWNPDRQGGQGSQTGKLMRIEHMAKPVHGQHFSSGFRPRFKLWATLDSSKTKVLFQIPFLQCFQASHISMLTLQEALEISPLQNSTANPKDAG